MFWRWVDHFDSLNLEETNKEEITWVGRMKDARPLRLAMAIFCAFFLAYGKWTPGWKLTWLVQARGIKLECHQGLVKPGPTLIWIFILFFFTFCAMVEKKYCRQARCHVNLISAVLTLDQTLWHRKTSFIKYHMPGWGTLTEQVSTPYNTRVINNT